MIDRLRRLGGPTPSQSEQRPHSEPEARDLAEVVNFRGFTATSIVTGTFEMRADRLTDALNGQTEISINAATVFDIDTLRERQMPSLLLPRGSLLLVCAAGRRGSARRRFRALPHAVTLTVGPYRVEGMIHTVPGADPTAIYHRHTMVPLTDVTVSYGILGRPIADAFDAVIVNREAITSIVRTRDTFTERVRNEPVAPRLARNYATGDESEAAMLGVLQPSTRAFKIVWDPRATPAYLPGPPRLSRQHGGE